MDRKDLPFALVFSRPVPDAYREGYRPFDAVAAASGMLGRGAGTRLRPRVLIVAIEGDAIADAVGTELVRRGVATARFDVDRLNDGSSLAFQGDDRGLQGELVLPAGTVSLADVRSVLFRWRPGAGTLPADGVEAFKRSESAQAVQGLEALLRGAFWLDRPPAVSASGSKLEHLRRASALGFRIPRTLVTNQPGAARAFLRSCPSAVVKAFSWLWDDDLSGRRVIYTHRLRPEDEGRLDLVANAPCIFQEEVPRSVEARVTVVGQRVFAAAIQAADPAGPVDWRDPSCDLSYRPHELPREVVERCLGLTRELGLSFATLDLIETPAGEHVFLDFNPFGNWLHVESRTGLPITAAVADLLLKGSSEDRG